MEIHASDWRLAVIDFLVDISEFDNNQMQGTGKGSNPRARAFGECQRTERGRLHARELEVAELGGPQKLTYTFNQLANVFTRMRG